MILALPPMPKNITIKHKGIPRINDPIAIGSLILGIPLCLIVIFLGMGGKASIINGPVISFEITQQGSNGLYLLYLMAVYLAVFAVSMLIQFTSYFMSSSHKLLKN